LHIPDQRHLLLRVGSRLSLILSLRLPLNLPLELLSKHAPLRLAHPLFGRAHFYLTWPRPSVSRGYSSSVVPFVIRLQ
jgi:hypothetical protein